MKITATINISIDEDSETLPGFGSVTLEYPDEVASRIAQRGTVDLLTSAADRATRAFSRELDTAILSGLHKNISLGKHEGSQGQCYLVATDAQHGDLLEILEVWSDRADAERRAKELGEQNPDEQMIYFVDEVVFNREKPNMNKTGRTPSPNR